MTRGGLRANLHSESTSAIESPRLLSSSASLVFAASQRSDANRLARTPAKLTAMFPKPASLATRIRKLIASAKWRAVVSTEGLGASRRHGEELRIMRRPGDRAVRTAKAHRQDRNYALQYRRRPDNAPSRRRPCSWLPRRSGRNHVVS